MVVKLKPRNTYDDKLVCKPLSVCKDGDMDYIALCRGNTRHTRPSWSFYSINVSQAEAQVEAHFPEHSHTYVCDLWLVLAITLMPLFANSDYAHRGQLQTQRWPLPERQSYFRILNSLQHNLEWSTTLEFQTSQHTPIYRLIVKQDIWLLQTCFKGIDHCFF